MRFVRVRRRSDQTLDQLTVDDIADDWSHGTRTISGPGRPTTTHDLTPERLRALRELYEHPDGPHTLPNPQRRKTTHGQGQAH